jgi:hypothetical protein
LACKSSSGGCLHAPRQRSSPGRRREHRCVLPTDRSAPTRRHARASRQPRARTCTASPRLHWQVVTHAVAVGPGRAPARPRRARVGRRPRAHAAVHAIAAHAQASGLLRAPARRAHFHAATRAGRRLASRAPARRALWPPACCVLACTPRTLATCCRAPLSCVVQTLPLF